MQESFLHTSCWEREKTAGDIFKGGTPGNGCSIGDKFGGEEGLKNFKALFQTDRPRPGIASLGTKRTKVRGAPTGKKVLKAPKYN